MPAKQKITDDVIPGWARYCMPHEFEFVTSLPADVVADRLYEAFHDTAKRENGISEYRDIKRNVIDDQTLRVDLHLKIIIPSSKKDTEIGLSTVAFLRDMGDKTQFEGVITLSKKIMILRILGAVLLTPFLIFTMALELSPESSVEYHWSISVLSILVFLFLLMWSLWEANNRHRQVAHNLTEALRQIVVDERKTAKEDA